MATTTADAGRAASAAPSHEVLARKRRQAHSAIPEPGPSRRSHDLDHAAADIVSFTFGGQLLPIGRIAR
jgi:hypothetical protein